MKRRTFISSVATLTAAGLAGCLGSGSQSDGSDGTDGTGESDGSDGSDESSGNGNGASGSDGSGSGTSEDPSTYSDVDLPLSMSELNRGAPKDAIPAITEPVFGTDWEGLELEVRDSRGDYSIEPRLEEDDTVIGVERDGEARAYPLRILNWHEIVNDTFDGPLLVTYCPLCGSGMTAVRKAEGRETVFGVSGLLWKSDLVMYDEATQSLWSQILATAIRGKLTGETLELVPSSFTTWGQWKEEYPDTKVLLPPPKSNTIKGEVMRNYSRNPYLGYDESERVGIGYNDFDDDRLHPKATVIGVADEEESRAYPLSEVKKAGVVNDTVGDRKVVVAVGPDDTLVAYSRVVEGEALTFERGSETHMKGGGSRWGINTGKAVDGPYEGKKLTRANAQSPMFWFAWLDFNPGTEVFRHTN